MRDAAGDVSDGKLDPSELILFRIAQQEDERTDERKDEGRTDERMKGQKDGRRRLIYVISVAKVKRGTYQTNNR